MEVLLNQQFKLQKHEVPHREAESTDHTRTLSIDNKSDKVNRNPRKSSQQQKLISTHKSSIPGDIIEVIRDDVAVKKRKPRRLVSHNKDLVKQLYEKLSNEEINFDNVYATLEKHIDEQPVDLNVLYALTYSSVYLYRNKLLNYYYYSISKQKMKYTKINRNENIDPPLHQIPVSEMGWDIIYAVLEFYINENPEENDRDLVLKYLINLSTTMFEKKIEFLLLLSRLN
ncbi:unnamed protein product [Mytilus coruscus]|uniref:Uncharacterized protein n=1 Tax=Mytilus coruscus TaxID=42192 RepID=A0A6J8BXJ0_MYTCO|nr:unnamed protein product [Mytilus coruscus]